MVTTAMDIQTRRAVKIVLSIERGVGFNFLKEPFTVCCSIADNILTTGPIKPKHTPIFDTRLIWETKFDEFQKLCLSNVPLKIDIFTHQFGDDRQQVGYMLLSLLAAKVCPPYDENKVNCTWHRLLGVRAKGRSSNPQLLLKLVLQDTRDKAINNDELKMYHSPKENKNVSNIENIDIKLLHLKNGAVQIGSNEKRKTLTFNVKLNNIVVSGIKETEESFHTKLTIFSKSYEIMNSIELNIQSNYENVKQYFNENPYLIIRLCRNITDLGLCFVDLRKIVRQNFTNEYEPLVYNERCVFMNQSLNENLNQANFEKPYLDIELSLKYNNQTNEHSQDSNEVIKSDLLESSSNQSFENDLKLDDLHEYKTVKTTNIKMLPYKENPKINLSFDKDQKSTENSMSPKWKEDNITKVVNELEDWMEHQKEMFKSYMIEKEKKHLEFLMNEWDSKRTEYESTLQNNVEQCQNLMLNLSEIVDSLKEKELQLEDREKKLRFVKDELELDYRTKYQELKNASKQMETNFEHQLKLHELEYKKMSSEIDSLKQENISLKKNVGLLDIGRKDMRL